MYSRAQIVALRRVVHRNKSRWSWHHHGGARESQFHGAADMTHVRYVHALRRAKAIFRSNMIIKSNGIRNSSGARILSTNPPLPPLRFLLRPMPALSFVAIHSRFPRDKARNAFHSFSFLLFFPALPALFFLCPSALTPAFTGWAGIGKLKGSIAEKSDGKRRNV